MIFSDVHTHTHTQTVFPVSLADPTFYKYISALHSYLYNWNISVIFHRLTYYISFFKFHYYLELLSEGQSEVVYRRREQFIVTNKYTEKFLQVLTDLTVWYHLTNLIFLTSTNDV